MTAVVLRGDARHLPLPDASVDLIVTSPPYFGLRSYTDNGEHYGGQIGSEATPQEWLASLLDCTAEWVRVLKPSGSIFVNLGDKFAQARGHGHWESRGGKGDERGQKVTRFWADKGAEDFGLLPKSLMGLPWRYAIACTDQLGLILRRDIVWHKLNSLPESVTDRCRSSHEYLFHLTKSPRYYAAVDEIREPHLFPNQSRTWGARSQVVPGNTPQVRPERPCPENNPLGKLPGSVWSIPSQPLTVPAHLGVSHFAAFPMELPRRVILGWSPPGVCVACGEGRRPVGGYDREPAYRDVQDKRINEEVTVRWCAAFADWCEARSVTRADLNAATGTSDMGGWWASRLPHRCVVPTPEQYALLAARWPEMPTHPGDELWEPFTRRVAWSFHDAAMASRASVTGRHRHTTEPVKGIGRTITGYACACRTPDAPTRPAVVVDPFGGTGTTALVASVLGRRALTFDLSADYCRLARWRIADPGERARAMQVPKPPPVPIGQEALFGASEAS